MLGVGAVFIFRFTQADVNNFVNLGVYASLVGLILDKCGQEKAAPHIEDSRHGGALRNSLKGAPGKSIG